MLKVLTHPRGKTVRSVFIKGNGLEMLAKSLEKG
jgi:hypothetical protein